jgi:hypothetical protein
MFEIADQFEDDGWDTIRIRPGDITVLTGEYSDTFGLDIMVSRDTFDEVYEVHEKSEVDAGSYELFREESNDRLYLIVGIKYPSSETIVFYPSITELERSKEMFETARENGEMRTRLRPLSKEKIITVTHENPELFYDKQEAA